MRECNRAWRPAAGWTAAGLAVILVACRSSAVGEVPEGATGGPRSPAASVEALPSLVDEAAVRRVFADYKDALLSGDGVAAVELVDRATLDYYAEIRELAARGSEEAVRSRSFIDRLLIIGVRHQIGVAGLEELELADLIRQAVEERWIQPASIAQLDLGDVELEGDLAFGEALTQSSAGPVEAAALGGLRYEFIREAGRWRFRFASLVRSLDRVVSQFAAQLGTDENDLIFALVEAFSGRKVLPEVWERPE